MTDVDFILFRIILNIILANTDYSMSLLCNIIISNIIRTKSKEQVQAFQLCVINY